MVLGVAILCLLSGCLFFCCLQLCFMRDFDSWVLWLLSQNYFSFGVYLNNGPGTIGIAKESEGNRGKFTYICRFLPCGFKGGGCFAHQSPSLVWSQWPVYSAFMLTCNMGSPAAWPIAIGEITLLWKTAASMTNCISKKFLEDAVF